MNLRTSALVLGLLVIAAACSTPGGSGSVAPIGTAPDVTATDEPGGSNPPTPTAVAGNGFCDPANLYAEVISWDSGAGHRTATVQLTNIGTVGCKIHSLAKPQLVGGDGAILMQGATPASSTTLSLDSNDIVSTMVQDANYCGSAPVAPVTVAFVFPSGEGRVIANPVSPDDLDGVPPCNGAGSGGQIEMQPFAP
jgi:Protein of unknown function (DUF4232)